MNKFLKNLTQSNQGLKEKRASVLSTFVENGYKRVITDLESKLMNKEMQFETLMDLSPSQTTQLKFDTPDNADEFARKIHNITVEIHLTKQELKIAKDVYSELFTDVEEDKSSSQD